MAGWHHIAIVHTDIIKKKENLVQGEKKLCEIYKNKKMKDAIAAIAPEALLADGFDNALVGIARQFTKTVALYDYDACVKLLMKRDGMTQEGAIEFMEYNVLGAWVGENTPAFVIGSRHLIMYDTQKD